MQTFSVTYHAFVVEEIREIKKITLRKPCLDFLPVLFTQNELHPCNQCIPSLQFQSRHNRKEQNIYTRILLKKNIRNVSIRRQWLCTWKTSPLHTEHEFETATSRIRSNSTNHSTAFGNGPCHTKVNTMTQQWR